MHCSILFSWHCIKLLASQLKKPEHVNAQCAREYKNSGKIKTNRLHTCGEHMPKGNVYSRHTQKSVETTTTRHARFVYDGIHGSMKRHATKKW